MALSAPIIQPFVEDDAIVYSKNTVWRRFRKHKLAMAGAVVLLLMVSSPSSRSKFAPYDPNAIDNVHWQGNPLPPCFQDASQCGGHIAGNRRDRPRFAFAVDLRRADLADGRRCRRAHGSASSARCSARSPATTAAGWTA